MIVIQKTFKLPAAPRGFHLITDAIEQQLPEIKKIQSGVLQVFIRHTSASISINENADPTVRVDFETLFNKLIPENFPHFIHTYEGSDDMPAHIKSSLLGHSVTVPITAGKLNLGTWQGIYLGEHRNHGGSRQFTATAWGI